MTGTKCASRHKSQRKPLPPWRRPGRVVGRKGCDGGPVARRHRAREAAGERSRGHHVGRRQSVEIALTAATSSRRLPGEYQRENVKTPSRPLGIAKNDRLNRKRHQKVQCEPAHFVRSSHRFRVASSRYPAAVLLLMAARAA
jgi:hypothetical protein